MTPRDAYRVIAEALPAGSAVPVPREMLLEWLGESCEAPAAVDLDVQAVADLLGRKASTVRSWCASGRLRGYRLNSREWRVTPAALAAFQEQQRGDAPVSLGAWRKA
jgi:excisionase family DNA binding protein